VIVANNTSTQNGADYDLSCKNPGVDCTVTGINNLIMVSNATPPNTLTGDPQLAPLANNGGPTQTHALMIGSLAIDAGANPSNRRKEDGRQEKNGARYTFFCKAATRRDR
jgi:hypothetical protein